MYSRGCGGLDWCVQRMVAFLLALLFFLLPSLLQCGCGILRSERMEVANEISMREEQIELNLMESQSTMAGVFNRMHPLVVNVSYPWWLTF